MAESQSSTPALSPPLSPSTWPSWIAVFLMTLVSMLPAVLRNGLAVGLAKLSRHLNSKSKQIFSINIQAAYPQLDEKAQSQIFTDHLAALFQTVFLMPRYWWRFLERMPVKSELIGSEWIDQAKAANQQIIMLASHTVALDSGLRAIAPHYPVDGIYKPFDNPVLEYVVMRGRMRHGAQPQARGAGLRPLLKKMAQGSMLCYLSDEDLGREGSVFAPFFGHQKSTLAMLPRLAKRSGAVVIPMYSVYDAKADTVKVHFLEPLQNYPGDDEIENATIMNAAIERTIAICPEQFIWKLRIFRTCPKGGVSRYQQIRDGELTPKDM